MNPDVLQLLVAVGGYPYFSPSASLIEKEAMRRRRLGEIWLYMELMKHLSSEECSPSDLLSGCCLSSSHVDRLEATYYAAVQIQ